MLQIQWIEREGCCRYSGKRGKDAADTVEREGRKLQIQWIEREVSC